VGDDRTPRRVYLDNDRGAVFQIARDLAAIAAQIPDLEK
jgi:hypothetical protein